MYAAHNFVCKCEVLLVAREEDSDFGHFLLTLRRTRQTFAGPPAPRFAPNPAKMSECVAAPFFGQANFYSLLLTRGKNHFQLNMQLCNRVE